MGVPPRVIQEVLLRETLATLVSYSWRSTVELNAVEMTASDDGPSTPEFIREFRARHAIATARRLHAVVEAIDPAVSNRSGLIRTESRAVIRGRLDVPRYLARHATLRSVPRRYPVVQSTMMFDTPENLLTTLAITQVRDAMRDSPFARRRAEGVAALGELYWATDRLRRRPWDGLHPPRDRVRLTREVATRVRRQQTGNDGAYSELLHWFDLWDVDVAQLREVDRSALVDGLLAFPTGEMFWDKMFEVWCMTFVVAALENMGWTRTAGPVALHHPSGEIYRYRSLEGVPVTLRFQRKKPLPDGRWRYRGGAPLSGVPDITLATDTDDPRVLLIDAKNRFMRSSRTARSEESYKMLGYAENFGGVLGNRPFHGVLIFPADQDASRVLDGPASGRLDIVGVDLDGDRSSALAALSESIAVWIGTALTALPSAG